MLWSWNSWCESWLRHCQFSALEQFTEPLPPCVRYDCLGNLMHYLCVSDSILLERVFWMQIPHLKSNLIQYLAIPVPKELLLLFCRYYQILIHEPDPIVCLPLNMLCIQTRRYFFPLPKISKIWTFLSISIAIHRVLLPLACTASQLVSLTLALLSLLICPQWYQQDIQFKMHDPSACTIWNSQADHLICRLKPKFLSWRLLLSPHPLLPTPPACSAFAGTAPSHWENLAPSFTRATRGHVSTAPSWTPQVPLLWSLCIPAPLPWGPAVFPNNPFPAFTLPLLSDSRVKYYVSHGRTHSCTCI